MILEDIARWTLPKICLPFEVSLVRHFGLDFFVVSVVKISLTSGRHARKIVAFDETLYLLVAPQFIICSKKFVYHFQNTEIF